MKASKTTYVGSLHTRRFNPRRGCQHKATRRKPVVWFGILVRAIVDSDRVSVSEETEGWSQYTTRAKDRELSPDIRV
ncbi:MAG: hypothetical protein ABL952_16355 [Pyrinomonadaceae bacterium]